jgi:hypothetical protein
MHLVRPQQSDQKQTRLPRASGCLHLTGEQLDEFLMYDLVFHLDLRAPLPRHPQRQMKQASAPRLPLQLC